MQHEKHEDLPVPDWPLAPHTGVGMCGIPCPDSRGCGAAPHKGTGAPAQHLTHKLIYLQLAGVFKRQ